jgi:dimethylhistidine N-methyltransferase
MSSPSEPQDSPRPQQRVNPRLIDYHPPRADMRSDVLAGLGREQKQLAPKYFYDQRGSRLFEDITRLPEYYLTPTEAGIMTGHLPEIAQQVGPRAAVIEFGSGTGEKIRKLLQGLEQPVACVPVDISRNHLLESASALAKDFPELDVVAVCADFTQPFDLPKLSGAERKLVFFPGSTIGNFTPEHAVSLLKVMRQVAGRDGALLIGVDLVKDRATLEAAYNDSQGVTAQFNLNLLKRINRELNADFKLNAFSHQAVYNDDARRIEMYLVSAQAQQVHIGTQRFVFAAGERILTEYAHKHDPESFAALASQAGLRVEQAWTDPRQYFSVHYLVSV